MRNRTLRTIVLYQGVIVLIFALLTIAGEFLDLPHLLLGDAATAQSQRLGEILVEAAIFGIALCLQLTLALHLHRRIKILEGFLPICANCKRIRNDRNQWEQIEQYITEHSLAEFTHSICPECMEKLYPDINLSREDEVNSCSSQPTAT